MAWWRILVEYFTPESLRGDLEAMRRLRLMVGLSHLGLVLGGMYGVFYLAIGHYWGMAVIVVCIFLQNSVPFLIRATGRVRLGAHLSLAVWGIGFTCIAAVGGGIHAFAIAWLACGGPLLALLLLDRRLLGMDRGAFLDSAERLQKQGRLITPRRGFYVIVPPQYRAWGAPPADWYVDDLMRHDRCAYYVGLLKAAELHGATHQAVMEFQVITAKRMPRISAGRTVLSFSYRKDLEACRGGIEDHKTDTGRMKISSVELTALDLMRYAHASGGIRHIATVLSDLGKKIDDGKLAALAPAFERPVVQRTGWLLEHLGFGKRTEKMHLRFLKEEQRPWTELEPSLVGDPDLTPPPIEKNTRWNIVVRHIPEVDE